ncbi:MAG: flagellar assembly protein FliW [Campylobacteraceae bacterium]|nr:flagellar assembly protein FliW [Campylobacteraceae bacterium]
MVFEVKYPILGFENVTSYDFETVDDNFATIKNTQDSVPAFTLINPFVLREYSFDIPLAIKTLMELKEDSNLLVYLILIVKKPFKESLANFLAPIVFNVDNKTMSQVVLDENIYTDYLPAEQISKFIVD